ncbi:hypothetical protein [Streptomyces sp. NPDC058401]|uniref:hypothetical protein n=1 Tax=Streptomyces sp. NPDC058401 TaxID=3346480 RepID=UPI003651626E
MGPEAVNPELTAEDYASARAAEEVLEGRESLNAALARWRLVVLDIEAGFDLEFVYEYEHGLACRDGLRRAWPLLTARVREIRQPVLDRWDDRFFAATRPMALPDAGNGERGGRWWTRRFPVLCFRGEGQVLPAHWSPPPRIEEY